MLAVLGCGQHFLALLPGWFWLAVLELARRQRRASSECAPKAYYDKREPLGLAPTWAVPGEITGLSCHNFQRS
jgi:hypothetical protein